MSFQIFLRYRGEQVQTGRFRLFDMQTADGSLRGGLMCKTKWHSIGGFRSDSRRLGASSLSLNCEKRNEDVLLHMHFCWIHLRYRGKKSKNTTSSTMTFNHDYSLHLSHTTRGDAQDGSKSLLTTISPHPRWHLTPNVILFTSQSLSSIYLFCFDVILRERKDDSCT